jgi:hypothetical protein
LLYVIMIEHEAHLATVAVDSADSLSEGGNQVVHALAQLPQLAGRSGLGDSARAVFD